MAITQFRKAKFCRRPEDDILGEAGKVHAEDRKSGEKFEGEVTIANAVETVLRNPGESEFFGHGFAIQHQG